MIGHHLHHAASNHAALPVNGFIQYMCRRFVKSDDFKIIWKIDAKMIDVSSLPQSPGKSCPLGSVPAVQID